MAKLVNGKSMGKFEESVKNLINRLSGKKTLRVGFLEGATYPDGKSVPFVAAMNEFGHEYNGVVTPPRPFFRNMIKAKSGEWPAAMAGLLKSNNFDVHKTLMKTGEGIQGQLIQSINDLTTPALAESTIARKGFDKPLIDDSIMVNSTGYEVKG